MPRSAGAEAESVAQDGLPQDLTHGSAGGDVSAPSGEQDAQPLAAEGGSGGKEATGADVTNQNAGGAEGGSIDLANEVPAWRTHFEQAGLVDFETIDEAAERAAQALRQRQEQLDEAYEQNRYYRQRMTEMEQTGRVVPPQGPQAQGGGQTQDERDAIARITEGWNDVPAHVVQQYVHSVRDPETGEYRQELMPNTPPEIRQQIEETSGRIHQWQQVISDPRKLIPAIESRVQRMIDERLETGLSERERRTSEQQAIDRFKEENSGWLYQVDPISRQPLLDRRTQQPVLSEQGQQFAKFVGEAKDEWGITSPARQLEFARMRMNVQEGQRQQVPEVRRAEAQSVIDEKRRAMQARLNPRPAAPKEVNGVSPLHGADEPGQKQKSYGERTLERAKLNGAV